MWCASRPRNPKAPSVIEKGYESRESCTHNANRDIVACPLPGPSSWFLERRRRGIFFFIFNLAELKCTQMLTIIALNDLFRPQNLQLCRISCPRLRFARTLLLRPSAARRAWRSENRHPMRKQGKSSTGIYTERLKSAPFGESLEIPDASA